MKKTKTIKLEKLTGKHILSGVDFDTLEVKTWGENFEKAQAIRFILDGKTYIAVEDPDDGYRSSMDYLILSEISCVKTFEGVKVLGRMKSDGEWEKNNTLEFVNISNGKLVLAVGTDNISDYYPWYVAEFHPENLV